jgi:Flp pilus assembly CpaE family ATPase
VITLDEVERTLGMKVFRTLANDYESVIRSINTGQPVIDNEKSPFARDLRSLGAELSGLVPETNGHRNRLLPSWVKRFGRQTAAKEKSNDA